MTVTLQTNTTLPQIAQALLEHDDYLICGHISPDGDCVGSQLALMHALRAAGKTAHCVLAGDKGAIDKTLRFLPGIDGLICADEAQPQPCFIALDVPTLDRMGDANAALHQAAQFTVTIDHHANDERISTLAYVDPDAASTTCLVWELSSYLLKERTVDIATCAYTGLLTDTGRFQFQNTNADAFCKAAEMVALGIDVPQISSNLFANRSLASVRLEERMLSRMELLMDGAFAISYVTLSDFEELGATKPEADTLVTTLRSIEGVRVACMLRETEENVRGSLRAKDDTDVSVFARQRQGGGHKAASGMTLEPGIERAFDQTKCDLVGFLTQAWTKE